MRNAFSEELTRQASMNDKVVLLSGDIGNKLFDKMKALAPDKVINAGVAEANMIGVASGLALVGFRPIAYTITPFITSRCLEQIRNDVCYHDLPVILIGVGSGLGYSTLGPTHHACEDICFLRSLPGMTILCPADPSEVKVLLRKALECKGPVYMRIGKKGEPQVHKSPPELEIGKANKILSKGKGVCILNCGVTLPMAIEIANDIANNGKGVEVINFHTVKPLDLRTLSKIFSEHKIVVTIEEHGLIGGFGSAIAEWYSDNLSGKSNVQLLRFGTRDEFMHVAGEQNFSREYYGITRDKIVARILEVQD